MDVCARGLKAAAAMLEDDALEAPRRARYAGWQTDEAKAMLSSDLASIAERVEAGGVNPEPRTGQQEKLENIVNRYV